MQRRITIAAVVALALAAGGWLAWRSFSAPPAPPRVRYADLDPLVAEQLTALVAQVEARPRDTKPRAELAMALHANNVFDLAEIAYRQAIDLDPDEARLWYHLASVVAERYGHEAAMVDLEHAIALDGNYAPAHWRHGFWLLELGHLDRAREAFERAVALEPMSVAPRVGLARVALHERRAELAATTLEGLVREQPEVDYLQYLLGRAYRQLGREDEAARLLASASGSAPAWDDPWTRALDDLQTGYEATLTRAQNLLLFGQPDRALDMLRPMMQTHPGDPELMSTIGSAHVVAGRTEEGLRILEQSARTHPRHYPTHLSLSMAYSAKGDLDQAFRHAARAVELNPAFGPAHLELGKLSIRAGRPEAAVESLRDAVRFGSDDANTRLLLGSLLERLSRWTEALEVYERLHRRSPTSSAALGLARARAATGDVPGAWERIREVRDREPAHRDLAPTIEYVRRMEGAGR